MALRVVPFEGIFKPFITKYNMRQFRVKSTFIYVVALLSGINISLPKGMETCYAGEISMYTERENRIQVATLEKTQLIAKDFSELRIHFWPDERALKKVVTGKEQRMTERAKKRRKKKHLSR
ncbi:predicted protein [Histoplasma mississippiense (nom. inval.)]|uniref:predicted protein n=1 Tax=Ajellomyces capsulatus (strain NAm1 / WU24) TaxID=2059318 RepID=UPI000157D3AC|nr:predicted protein [Histoplasma mississippiense (nom. inval.)]EDN04952.1 predicted protein [Histoplasma mississippiense (nom. inval.)]